MELTIYMCINMSIFIDMTATAAAAAAATTNNDHSIPSPRIVWFGLVLVWMDTMCVNYVAQQEICYSLTLAQYIW